MQICSIAAASTVNHVDHPSLFRRKSVKWNNIGDEPISIGNIWYPFGSISFALSPFVAAPLPCTASLDWKETPDHHSFIADVPGVKEEDVKIEVEEEKVLTISGERRREREEKSGDRWHRVERSTEKFLRRVKLPKNTDVEGIKATLENGVLTVTVPKEPDTKKTTIARFITIK